MKRCFGACLAGLLILAACTSKPSRTHAANPSPSVSPSPTPHLIAFVSSTHGFGPGGGPSAIELIDETGSNRRVVYRSEMQIGSLTWSSDGSQLAFTQFAGEFSPPGGIWVVNVDGTRLRRIADAGFGPAWSPKGDLIAFAKSGNGHSELYLMRTDGTGQRRLVSCGSSCADGPGDISPSWSPDGQQIVFQHGNEVFIVNADGSGLRRVTRCGKNCVHQEPAWSPDGSRIAFIAGSGTLWAVRPDGTTLRQLYACQGRSCLYVSLPRWSPDGKTILFTGAVLGGRGGQIVTLTLNQSIRTLTSPPPAACCAAWRPAGRT